MTLTKYEKLIKRIENILVVLHDLIEYRVTPYTPTSDLNIIQLTATRNILQTEIGRLDVRRRVIWQTRIHRLAADIIILSRFRETHHV